MARRPGKFAVGFVFITVFIDMVGFGLVMPVLPRLIEQVSGSDLAGASIWGGWLFFAYGGMQFLFGPAIGNLSDAFGRRPVLLLSVLGLAVDYLLTGFAPSMMWLFVGRIFAGICGASYTTANAFLADITPPAERAKVFGLMGAAFGLGFVIGPAIGGLLGEFGARVPFFVAAGLSILNFVYGWFVLPETLAPENRRGFSLARSNPVGALKVFAQYRGVVPLSAIMFLYFFATAVYPAIWAFWGIAAFGWTEATVGLTLAAFGLVTAVVQGGLTGPIVKWLGERNTAVFGLVMAVVAAVGYGLAPRALGGADPDRDPRAGRLRAPCPHGHDVPRGTGGCAGRNSGRHCQPAKHRHAARNGDLHPGLRPVPLPRCRGDLNRSRIFPGGGDAGRNARLLPVAEEAGRRYSTVTDFARFLGWSTSVPMNTAA